jgi:hypothetical protein
MALSVSLVRPLAGKLRAEFALQADGRDLLVFRYATPDQAAQAADKLKSAVAAAGDIVRVE